MNRPIILLEDASADVVGESKNNTSGTFVLVCEGDFGGGTLTLQTSIAGSDWQNVHDSNGDLLEVTSTDDYASRIFLVSAMVVRATLAGATNPDLTVKLA